MLLNGYIYLYSYARDSAGFLTSRATKSLQRRTYPGLLRRLFPRFFPKGSCRSSRDSAGDRPRKNGKDPARKGHADSGRPAHGTRSRNKRCARRRVTGSQSDARVLSLFLARRAVVRGPLSPTAPPSSIVCRSSLASRVSGGARTKTRPLKPQVGALFESSPFPPLLSLSFRIPKSYVSNSSLTEETHGARAVRMTS